MKKIIAITFIISMFLIGCGADTTPVPTPTPQLVSDSMIVKGELVEAKLFTVPSVDGVQKPSSKWLWMVKVLKVTANETWSGNVPAIEDIITLDVNDSKANLFVETVPINCTDVTGVAICDYKITRNKVIVLVKVKTELGGQEYYGIPQ